jgi:sugar/nucleoside kinase (ribokinase family)
MKRITCTGIVVVDALSGPLERYPVPGGIAQVVTEQIRFAPGGGACNTSTALARMGLPVRIFAKVGDDANGHFVQQTLAACGVDTHHLRLTPEEQTPFTFVGIHPDGERTFIHTPGTNLTFSLADLDLEALLDTDILFYQDCWVLPQLDGAPAAQLLATAQQRGIITALDATWGLGPRRDVVELVAPYCDYLLVSLAEFQHIYPAMSTAAIAGHLQALGVKTVVLKMGKDGVFVSSVSGDEQVPGYPATVVDTTGAGDCWDAGFLAALAHGEPLHRAARIGHACAAFGIEAVGGATGVPEYATVLARAI